MDYGLTEDQKEIVELTRKIGKERILPVRAKLDEEEEQVASADGGQQPDEPQDTAVELSELGIALSKASPAVRERFDLPEGIEGVVVTDVVQDGPAYEEGVRPGDVVAEVSQEKVGTPAEAKRLVDAATKAGKRSVLLFIEGQAGFRFVAVRLK